MRCLQSVKDTKFESNSQLDAKDKKIDERCLQSVKDTKFESNSQPGDWDAFSKGLLFAVRQRYKV